MAIKLPYMQFYVNDFDEDTASISSLAVGVWIRILMAMHKKRTGSISGTLEKLSQITRATVDELKTGLVELSAENVANIHDIETLKKQICNAPCNAVVTVICRRLKREEEKRILTSERVNKLRAKRDCNAPCNAVVTQEKSDCNATHAPKESESEPESEIKKENKRKKIFSFVGVDFFPEKFKTKTFTTAWQEWEVFRREKRCALTESTAKKQLAMLSAFDESEAIAILDKSITNGWQGLFPTVANAAKNESESAFDKFARGEQI